MAFNLTIAKRTSARVAGHDGGNERGLRPIESAGLSGGLSGALAKASYSSASPCNEATACASTSLIAMARY